MQQTQVGLLQLHGHMLPQNGRTVHAARVQHFDTMCAWQAQVTLALRMSVYSVLQQRAIAAQHKA